MNILDAKLELYKKVHDFKFFCNKQAHTDLKTGIWHSAGTDGCDCSSEGIV